LNGAFGDAVLRINRARGRGFMAYNTMNEQTPINADIKLFVHTIFAFAVLLGIFFFIISYANAIHSTVVNVPECLLLIGLTLTAKRGNYRMYLFLLQCFALCVAVLPLCIQTVIDTHLFVLNSKHGRSDVMVFCWR
jgi:hypothetical protein